MSTKKLKLNKLLGITIIPVVIVILFIFGGKIIKGSGIKYLVVGQTKTTQVDKKDPKWLANYCRGEVKNLPQPPFKFIGLDGDIHMTIPDIVLKNLIPKDKWNSAVACALWYDFEPKAAYDSLGVAYLNHIDSVNAFEKNTDGLISVAIDKGWKKLSPLGAAEDGRPGYSYGGFPMIFTRENSELKTIEYVTMNFGGNEFYIQFIVYEK